MSTFKYTRLQIELISLYQEKLRDIRYGIKASNLGTNKQQNKINKHIKYILDIFNEIKE